MKHKVTEWKKKEDASYSDDMLIRLNTNKPEYGSIMLVATVISIVGTYMNKRNRIAFVTSKVDDLQDLIEEYHLIAGSDFSAEVAPHRIVVLELLESEVGDELGYSEKVNPSTGEVLSKDGQVIFRKTQLVAEGSDIVDITITHDEIPVNDEARAEFKKTESNVIASL